MSRRGPGISWTGRNHDKADVVHAPALKAASSISGVDEPQILTPVWVRHRQAFGYGRISQNAIQSCEIKTVPGSDREDTGRRTLNRE